MNSKKILKIFIVIVILLISGITIFSVFESFAYKKRKKEIEENFSWKAKYIWFADERNLPEEIKSNEWVCFRKKININSWRDIKWATAKIAVDSKYWLYVNDELVIREGGLKRGQNRSSIYYDEVSLEKYLKKGENTISILVWYFGKTSYSHISTQNGALLFQMDLLESSIISDNSWKTIQNPAFKKDVPIINQRLSEENIYYDATEEIASWYKSDFNDSSWANAIEITDAKDVSYGELIARNIPFFEFSDLKEYNNSYKYTGKTFNEDTLLELNLPYNMQFLPYFKIKSEAEKIIYITLDKEYNSSGKEHKTTYITKSGTQDFESPAWVNGEKIYYFIPKGVTIEKLGYIQTNYKIDESGKFSTNDEFYNKLWNKAYNTLRVNMRDSYMDCPDRERAAWWGDTSISMEEAIYSLDTYSNYLYKKGVKTTIGYIYDDIFLTISPTSEANSIHAPIQMLLGIVSMYDYYLYTGDINYLKEIYKPVKNYLYLWEVENDGLVSYRDGFALWRWEDSAGDNDYVATENAWYYYALSKFYDMAIVLDKQEDLNNIKQRLDRLNEAYNQSFYTGIGYKEWQIDRYDIRANAVAVLSGLADEVMYDEIAEILLSDNVCSPFMEKYVEEALCKMGKIEEAQERIKSQYKEMVDSKESTLSEYFDLKTGSSNHAWSGGPIIIFQKYFAGITPSNPGFTEINVKPQFGTLKKIESKVNTVSGTINLNCEKEDEELKIQINTPVRTRIAIEKMSDNPSIYINGLCAYKNGKSKYSFKGKYEREDENYIYYFIEKGNCTITSK